jgi:hypothetical protein
VIWSRVNSQPISLIKSTELLGANWIGTSFEVTLRPPTLIPAIVCYEWDEVKVTDPATGEIKKAKQPHYLHLPGNRILAFAGEMSLWAPG